MKISKVILSQPHESQNVVRLFIYLFHRLALAREPIFYYTLEQRISQRDILRRFCVALSDIIPLQKRAHPCGAFFAL